MVKLLSHYVAPADKLPEHPFGDYYPQLRRTVAGQDVLALKPSPDSLFKRFRRHIGAAGAEQRRGRMPRSAASRALRAAPNW